MRSVVLGIVCVLVGTARADSDAKRATALFDDAQVLRKQGRLADACEKFEQSYQLDPAIGTELNVADCREREGKLDEAYRLFDHAAHNDKRPDRAKYARARADSIQKSLDKIEKHEAASEPPPDPPPDEDPRHEAEREPVEPPRDDPQPEPLPAPVEAEHPPTAWRVVFAGSLTVVAAGVGLIIYGHHQITDATQKLCDGSGYPPQDRADLCTGQPSGPILTPAQVDTLNRQGEQGRNLVIGGELAAVIGGGFAALGFYEGFIAKRSKARTSSVAVAPYVSPAGAGATVGWAW